MPRKTAPRKTAAQRKAEAEAAALAARPFADGSTAPFASLDSDAQRDVATAIAADKAAGLSGNELRAKYGERLTGPARRRVFDAFGLRSAATIAPSYVAYRDGESRKGTRHAREHGSLAAARVREQAEALAAATDAKAQRKALRDAGRSVPRKAEALRDAFVALLLDAPQGA